MADEIVRQYPEIHGVETVSNVFVGTGPASGILLGGSISTNVIRAPGVPTEYAVWGIHLATNDELTFVQKADDKPVIVRMVDCRAGSGTAGNYLEVECEPNPEVRIVIPRGVAHLPVNTNGLMTLNTPKIFWDYRPSLRRLVQPSLDVINVERDRPIDQFPRYAVCRYPVPGWMYAAVLQSFRKRFDPNLEAPFIFERDGKVFVLARKRSV